MDRARLTGQSGGSGERAAPSPVASRALQAMAQAAERSRAANAGGAELPVWEPSVPSWADPPPGAPPAGLPPAGRRPTQARLRAAVATAGGLLLVAMVALAGAALAHHHGGGGRGGVRAPSAGAASPAPPASATTTAPLPSAGAATVRGGGPVLTSLTPAAGSAGQTVQVSGATFFSADGHITATFGGQIAPISCPGQSTCDLTVPAFATPGTVAVTVTTDSGTSAPLTFTEQ